MESTQDKKTEEELIFGYLKGDLTPEETRELIDWIKLDKANKQIFDECCEIWITIQSSSTNPGYNVQEGFWKFRQRIRKNDQQVTIPLKVRFLRTAIRYAAIFVIAFLSGGILFYQFGNRSFSRSAQSISELVVPLGSRAQFTLADGTVVTLNAGSTLRTDNHFGINDRIVELEGEGYFKVAKDKKKPFIVKTPYLKVTALGTEFNIKAYSIDETIETTLVNGSVNIEPYSDGGKGEITILQPNQKLTFYKKDSRIEDNSKKSAGKSQTEIKPIKVQITASAVRFVKENVNIEPVVSWKESRWIFENQSLSQMAVDLERKFDVQILFTSEQLKSYKFTGTILAEPIEQVLEVMSITAPIDFKLDGRVVTLSEDKDLIKVNKNLYTQPK
ncbi:MAG TPA: FecR family protein [Bacteroidales bacterium]|nr:FecR family protein [Bacteroidales bacterium]